MDLKVSSATFGAGAKYASRLRVHQRHLPKTDFLNNVSKYVSPAGWFLLLSFLIGSIMHYGIKDLRQRYALSQNPTEVVTDTVPQNIFTTTQE